MDKFTLEINDFGRINKANIEINKINVVGGVNASGKSTASKLLYCFLKANSYNRESYILSKIIPKLNRLIKIVDIFQGNDDEVPDSDRLFNIYNDIFQGNDDEVPDRLDINANKFEVIAEYKKYVDKFQQIKNSSDWILNSLELGSVDTAIESLMEDNNILSSCILSYLLHDESLADFSYTDPNYGVRILKGNIKFYSNSFESLIYGYEIDEQGNVIDYNPKADYDWYVGEFYYSTKGSINKFNRIFYIGNLSLFDLDNYINYPLINKKPLFGYEYHMVDLITNLKKLNHKKNIPYTIQEIQKKIDNIIEGHFGMENSFNITFSEEDNEYIQPINTSSGIKQIGMLQLLLGNNHLIPGSFLIIDEPEVNLHPEWQFKFAQILVLLAKELDITLYLNSHSPMFIEAMEVLTQFYDLEDETNFYLTEKQENGKYDFVKIDYDNLYDLYDNLAKPYDIIEVYRLKTEYKKGNY